MRGAWRLVAFQTVIVAHLRNASRVFRSYRWRAKHLFDLSRIAEAFAGAMTVMQRFDAALVVDGVYVKSAGAAEKNLTFLRLPTPTKDDLPKTCRV